MTTSYLNIGAWKTRSIGAWNNTAVVGVATWYVDNETTGTEVGTQANPFKSIAAYFAAASAGDTVYIKATDTPYREDLSASACFQSTVYGDWTGSGITRGDARAKIYGSDAIETWSVYSGDTYSATFSDSSGVFAANVYGGDAHDYGVWYVEAGGDIRILEKGIDEDSLTSNQFHWDEVDTLYVNVGEDPDTGTIEGAQIYKVFEIYTDQQLFKCDFKFSIVGQKNDGCYNWLLSECEISYMAYHGFWCNENHATYIARAYRNNIHHCMGRGVDVFRKNGAVGQKFVFGHNQIWQNGLSGFYTDTIGSAGDYVKIYSNIVYGNNTLESATEGGIYVADTALYSAYIYADNNTSNSNFGYEFYAENTTDVHLEHISNNGYDSSGGDTIGGKWSSSDDQTGTISFTDAANGDFSVASSSGLVDAGRNATWQGTPDVLSFNGVTITDGSGDIISGLTVDIGAYEISATAAGNPWYYYTQQAA